VTIHRPLLIAAAVAALASAAACGGSHAAPSGMPSQAQGDQDFIDFTRCMRAHGVQMHDPVHLPGHTGLSLEMPERTAANQAAFTACMPHIQAIVNAKEAGATQQAAADMPALIRYARCMRAHDISMPDPGPDGQLNLGRVPGMSSNFGRYSPQFHAADRACRHLLPAGVQDNGTGP
jgi:hypothetical protein